MAKTPAVVKLSPDSLDWALAHVEKFGDTDIFPLPFEYAAIRHSWANVRAELSQQDLLTWVMQPHRRCLSPKHRYGFRISTQLDPYDQLIYTALVYELGADIEASRVPTKDRSVHSFRFKPANDGRFFDQKFGYGTFRERSRELASQKRCKSVVMADIADFFPRIYSHPLENALRACTAKSLHVNSIKRLLSQWNSSVSYGIPVGPAASRLLAEVAISDVDAALQSEKHKFCRYADDFRIFCKDERSAFESLALLARVLFENHGLTLQQHKTRIVDAATFLEINDDDEADRERSALSESFDDILKAIGIDDWYEPIEYADLSPEYQEQIDSLNLRELLSEQLTSGENLDIPTTRFILRRLAQLGSPEAVELITDDSCRVQLYTVLKDVVEYCKAIRGLDEQGRHQLGAWLLDLIGGASLGHLEYNRYWILSTFTSGREWDNEGRFVKIYNQYSDDFTRAESISAMGRAHQATWFKTAKRDFLRLSPWERRSFIAAASCLPGDEADFWYKSVKPQLNSLERVVVAWAKANPY